MYVYIYSNSLAFATEPIFASLANVLGRHDRLPAPIPSEVKVVVFYFVISVPTAMCFKKRKTSIYLIQQGMLSCQ